MTHHNDTKDQPNPSDEELMESYLAGDQGAFRALFERYRVKLYHLMRRRVADTEYAQEIVQQTFLQFHRARRDFRQGSRVKPWLYTIALNLRRDALRKLGRSRIVHTDEVPDVAESREDPHQAHQAQRLRQALQTLPDMSQTVLELHWFEGLTFKEIARMVGLSESAAKTRAHRAYKQLRPLLDDDAT